MKNRYFDLIEQTFYFPQEGFDIENGYLDFNGIPLIHLIRKYGTPLKLTYLPRIGAQIKRARNLFNRSMKNVGYNGQYYYCYCTKACHFRFILEEVLQNGAHLETSSSFDIDLIRKLHLQNQVDKNEIILCNGYKAGDYGKKISKLINEGFKNVIPILDNKEELAIYEELVENGCKIGMRVATEEEPNFQFYTSRLGIRNSEVIQFYKDRLANKHKFKLEVLHFCVDTGIKDTIYYWGEFKKGFKTYCELKKICPDLRAIDIGGELPIRNSLGFEYD